MPVSPQQLRSLRFDEGIRGYDKRQVDKVIQRVADLIEDLENRLADAERRASSGSAESSLSGEAAELDETLRRTLILAQRTADAAVKEAKEEASRIRGDAQAEADELLADARARNAQVEAEVDGERARLLAEARQDCEARIARVQAELADTHEAMRAELVEQVQNLTQVRELLAEDIERLEGHVATRREQVRSALDELRAVLDDPDKLHAAEPGIIDLDPVPDVEGYEPVVVRIESMAGLGPLEAEDDIEVEGGASAEADDPEGGPPTELHPVVDGPGGAEIEGSGNGADHPDEPARPAWADAVPAGAGEGGPSALGVPPRPGTGAGQDAEAMDRFFSESEEDRRSGWFRRKS
jgi:DivIVA domain-containing protein